MKRQLFNSNANPQAQKMKEELPINVIINSLMYLIEEDMEGGDDNNPEGYVEEGQMDGGMAVDMEGMDPNEEEMYQ